MYQSFCLFILFMRFWRQECWSGLPSPSPMDHILSELSTKTHPSWVTLHSMPTGHGSPLNFKDIKPVNPKENQAWILIRRTDADAPVLWPSDAKSWLIGKDPHSGKDWRQEEKGMTEDKMIWWHHWLNRHEIKQAQTQDGEDRETWHAVVHGVTNSQTQLSDWTTTNPSVSPRSWTK